MFDIVYQAALRAASLEDLRSELQGVFIDALGRNFLIRNQSFNTCKIARELPNGHDNFVTNVYLTAAERLAFEDRNTQVHWLLELGANVDNIARGYASAGAKEKADSMVTEHLADMNMIAQGFALTGYIAFAEDYRINLNIHPMFTILGYAQAGYDKQVKRYITHYTQQYKKAAQGQPKQDAHKLLQKIFLNLMTGYAQTEKDWRIRFYIDDYTQHYKEAAPGQPKCDAYKLLQKMYMGVIAGYALADHEEHVTSYLKQFSVLTDTFERSNEDQVAYETLSNAVNTAAYAYAFSGSLGYVTLLLQGYDIDTNALVMAYATAGNHGKVESYREVFSISSLVIVSIYASIENHLKVAEYFNKGLIDLRSVIYCYVKLGNIKKAEEYCKDVKANIKLMLQLLMHEGYCDSVDQYVHACIRRKTNASIVVDLAAECYAQFGLHAFVEYYRDFLSANVHAIAQGYALGGYTEHAKIYFETHHANINNIARAYARINHTAGVDFCKTTGKRGVCSAIAEGYALAGNHAKVQEYRMNYNAGVIAIARGYEYGASDTVIPISYQIISTLTREGDLGKRIIALLSHLEKTPTSRLKKLFIKDRLSCILEELKLWSSNPQITLKELCKQHDLELYKALNEKTLTPSLSIFTQRETVASKNAHENSDSICCVM